MKKQTEETREKQVHGTPIRPYEYYFCKIPEYFPGVPLHWHAEFEINLIHKGQGILFLEEQSHIIQAGDFIAIPPEMLHGIEGDMEYDTLVFSGELFNSSLEERSFQQLLIPLFSGQYSIDHPIKKEEEGYQRLYESALRLFDAVKKDSPLEDLYVKSQLFEILYLLFEKDYLMRLSDKEQQQAIFRPVLAYVASHYSEEISIETMAELMHVSTSYFHHCFIQTFHQTPGNYLRDFRLNQACHLLMDPAISVSEVAVLSGYSNLSNFNRQFKTRMHQTPSEYRKNHLKR